MTYCPNQYGSFALILVPASIAGSFASYYVEAKSSDTNDRVRARTVLELMFSVLFFAASAAYYANNLKPRDESDQLKAVCKKKAVIEAASKQPPTHSCDGASATEPAVHDRVGVDTQHGRLTKTPKPCSSGKPNAEPRDEKTARMKASAKTSNTTSDAPRQMHKMPSTASDAPRQTQKMPSAVSDAPRQMQARKRGGQTAHENASVAARASSHKREVLDHVAPVKARCDEPTRNDDAKAGEEHSQGDDAASLYLKYTRLISGCVRKENGPQRALSLLKEMDMKGIPPNVISFGAAIGVCAKSYCAYEVAEKLMDAMLSRGFEPDDVCYNAAIAACAKSGQVSKSMQLMQQMRKNGLKPSVITYNSAIDACAKAGADEFARKLLAQMRESGIEPDVRSYGAAINACAKRGQWEIAVVLLEEMQQFGLAPTVHHFSSAINACAKIGRSGESVELLESMRSMGVQPNQIVYFTAVSACSKAKDAGTCMHILAQMIQDGITPDDKTRAAMIHVLQVSEGLGKAEALSHLMQAGLPA